MPLYIDIVLRLLLWLLLAPLLPGIINKVKAWVAGRQGPPVLQLYYDLARLWRKSVVLSTLASPGFIIAPAVAWTAVVAAALLDRKSTRLNSSHSQQSRMPSSA